MKKRNSGHINILHANLRKKMEAILEMMAAIYESCEWFPSVQQTKLPPF